MEVTITQTLMLTVISFFTAFVLMNLIGDGSKSDVIFSLVFAFMIAIVVSVLIKQMTDVVWYKEKLDERNEENKI